MSQGRCRQQDIGTGTRTVLAQVVAEEFGLRAQDIDAQIGDTRFPPGPPSGGSRVTSSLTPAARNAAYRAARDVARRVAPLLNTTPEEVVFKAPEFSLGFREAVRKAQFDQISHRVDRTPDYEGYARTSGDLLISKHGIGGVQFVALTVDTETGGSAGSDERRHRQARPGRQSADGRRAR